MLDGDMFGAMKKESGVQMAKIKITKSKEIKKFYNHNVGDSIPQRQSLPNDGEGFRVGLMRKINKVIRDAKKDQG